MSPTLDEALAAIDAWPVPAARAVVVGPSGVLASRGDPTRTGSWASVTKLVTAIATLAAAEAGRLDLDEPAGPPGASVRHLLGHASGLPFEGRAAVSPPGRMRIYSNAGFDLLGELLAERHGRPIRDVLATEVLAPLDLADTRLVDRPSQGLEGSLDDLARLAHELLRPTLLAPTGAAALREVAFPGLRGVLPGIGPFDPLDWGLGAEVRGTKDPHWTGARNDPTTFGHFGGSGSLLWVDPVADVALAVLTEREFGPWALSVWPALADAVLAALSGPG